jgi:Protein of unknown function (DUF3562)
MNAESNVVEQLAHELRLPLETVRPLYQAEVARMSNGARILTFVPLLAAKSVKENARSAAIARGV